MDKQIIKNKLTIIGKKILISITGLYLMFLIGAADSIMDNYSCIGTILFFSVFVILSIFCKIAKVDTIFE